MVYLCRTIARLELGIRLDLWALPCASIFDSSQAMDSGSFISNKTTRRDAAPADIAQADGELYMINEAWLRPRFLPGMEHVGIH